MASVLATISEMLIMDGASLKVIFDVVTAYPFEHNFQVGKRDKELMWGLSLMPSRMAIFYSKNFVPQSARNPIIATKMR